MKCKYCDDKVYFSNDIQRWVHLHGHGEYYGFCKKCGYYTVYQRSIASCPSCGGQMKIHHIAYPVPEPEEKNT